MVETKITPLYVKTLAQKFDFGTILYLDFTKKSIFSVGCLPDCTALLTLDLSNNNIQGVSGLEKCVHLKMLKLSYNKIANASVLSTGQTGGLIKLQRLELQGNKISEIKNLPEGLPLLEVLYLQEFNQDGMNPICETLGGYRKRIYQVFPKLRALDGNRKATEYIDLTEALPDMDEEESSYNVRDC
jgi:hypothetical protein